MGEEREEGEVDEERANVCGDGGLRRGRWVMRRKMGEEREGG